MTAPQTVKAWSISANVRNPFTTQIDMTGWAIYKNHAFLLTKGWTVKFTSNGVTGPSGPTDTTDRMISNTAGSVRGATAGTPQSWTVLQNADGAQLLLAFQGSADSAWRVSMSPTGLYTLAGTTTHQPTATDEVAIATAGGAISAATSDNIMQIWARNDSRAWVIINNCNNAFVALYGMVEVTDLCASGVFAVPYVIFRYTSAARDTPIGTVVGGINSVAVGGVGFTGTAARIFTNAASRLVRLGAGDLNLTGAPDGFNRVVDAYFISNQPALQGQSGSPAIPIFWSGEKAVNLDGFIGSPIDWWMVYTSASTYPGFGMFLPGFEVGDVPGVSGGQTGVGDQRTNWFVSLASGMVLPWRNAAAIWELI
jgi:hypothetical protein